MSSKYLKGIDAAKKFAQLIGKEESIRLAACFVVTEIKASRKDSVSSNAEWLLNIARGDEVCLTISLSNLLFEIIVIESTENRSARKVLNFLTDEDVAAARAARDWMEMQSDNTNSKIQRQKSRSI